MLYGRADQEAAIDRLLADARSARGGALVLRGEAGIGKSALLAYAAGAAGSPLPTDAARPADAARPGDAAAPLAGGAADGAGAGVDASEPSAATGFTVLRVVGVEAESTLPYAGLQALLTATAVEPSAAQPTAVQPSAVEPGVAEVGRTARRDGRALADGIDRLPAPQAGVLRAALGLRASGPAAGAAEPESGADDRLLVGLAVMNLLSEQAEDGPVLVLVDDAHWLDQESAEALALAARRLRTEPVAIVFAIREPHAPVLRTPGLPELRVPRLDGAAAAELLDEWHPELSSDQRGQVLTQASGNPLALRELSGRSCLSEQPDRITACEEADSPLVDRVFADRLAALPESGRRALAVAAVDDTGSADTVLRALDRLGGTPADLAPAERDQLLWIAQDAVIFGHPLVRSTAYANTPAHLRIEAHRALADVLDGPDQQDRRAWHRAAATIGADESVAAELEQAAERARTRGGFSAAAAAYERAASLSPEADRRVARTIAAARSAAGAAAYEHAAELLNGLTGLTGPTGFAGSGDSGPGDSGWPAPTDTDSTSAAPTGGPESADRDAADHGAAATRAAIARVWAMLPERLRPAQTHELLVSAALELADDDTAWREAARAAWTANDFPTLEQIASCRDKLPRAGALAAAALATNRMSRGEHQDGIDELRALLASYPEPPDVTVPRTGPAGTHPAGRVDAVGLLRDGTLRARLLLIVGDLAGARDAAARVEHQARRVGAISVLPELQVILARCALFLGLLDDARVAASEGRELANDIGQPVPAAELAAILAELAALRGDEEAVRSLVTEPLNRDIMPAAAHANSAWSLLDLGLGRYDSAYDRLEAMLRGGRSMGVPAALPVMVEAAVRAGRPAAAESPLAMYERWAEHVAQPWTRAVAARCRALVTDDPDLFDQAAGPDALPLDRARADLLYGERLRRDRQVIPARTRLRAALETFERLGATPWAERARSELRATGETRTAREDGSSPAELLTPQELQVARLAATGASNREIGERLFLSPRTVGYHLAKSYPKLGIRSRTELAGLLAAEDGQTVSGQHVTALVR